MNSSTRMGVGGYQEEDRDAANSTSLGLVGSGGLTRSLDESDARRQMNRAFDENPHNTMIGLGPIMSSAEKKRSNMNMGMAQRTMAGMPGISTDTPFPVKSSASGRHMEVTDFGIACRTLSRDLDIPAMGGQSHATPRHLDPVRPAPEPKIAPVAIEPQPKVPEPKAPENEADPFANLPGVAPKPSSLVDEEFIDLTSKLFGDDFAAGARDVDDEEDGWDFDMGSNSDVGAAVDDIPNNVQAAAFGSDESKKVSAEPEKPVEIPIIETPKTEPEPVSSAVTGSTQASKPAEEPKPETEKPAQQQIQKAAENDVKSSAKSSNKMIKTSDIVVMGCAGVAMIVLIVWTAVAGANGVFGAPGKPWQIVLFASAFNIICDVLYFALRSKVRSMGLAIIFGLGIISLVLAMAMGGEALIHQGLFLIALALQLVCAAVCFLKK